MGSQVGPDFHLVPLQLGKSGVGVAGLASVVRNRQFDASVDSPVPLLRRRHAGLVAIVGVRGDLRQDRVDVGENPLL